MSLTLATPDVDALGSVLDALRSWQADKAPFQLHPGDVGWLWRTGAPATAAALRTWHRADQLVAVGMLDGPDLVRVAIAPAAHRDEDLGRRLVADLSAPDRGVLPAGSVSVESPVGALLPELLDEAGWVQDEVWTPLRRDLREPVDVPGAPPETIGADGAADWAEVQRSAFGTSLTVKQMVQRWHTMAGGPASTDSRSLVIRDAQGSPAAAVTVWSAGPGRTGLIEPMGVHEDHRGRGHGRAIVLAAAAALRDLGCTAALVATLSENQGGVAAYQSAGFEVLPERVDRRREP